MVGVATAALVGHTAPAAAASNTVRLLLPRLGGTGARGGVALSFDDGPHPEGTPAVLAALESLGWRATFFLLGDQVARFPDVARSVVAAGHEVGVHGYQHRNHLGRTPGGLRRDLTRARDVIADTTGVTPSWFRPPYGVLTGGTLLAARSAGLTPVLWTAWGRDWLDADGPTVTRTVLAGLRDGGTILLHDSDCTGTAGSWRGAAASLPLLAAALDNRGWRVRTLTEHTRSGGRR